jgi:hypothetical protein
MPIREKTSAVIAGSPDGIGKPPIVIAGSPPLSGKEDVAISDNRIAHSNQRLPRGLTPPRNDRRMDCFASLALVLQAQALAMTKEK